MEITKLKNELKKTITAEKDMDLFFYAAAENCKLDLKVELVKENITVNIYTVILGRKSNEFDFKTKVEHLAPNTNSRMHVKGLFLDNAVFNFEGMIKIGPKAAGSDAYLKNDNLVIGTDAIVNSSPQLEIENNDVKASHGVTIKTLENTEVYYLLSRGLDLELTEETLMKGFLNDLVMNVKDEKLSMAIVEDLKI